MKNIVRMIMCIVVLASSLIVARPTHAATATPGPCSDGVLPSGALSRICIPSSGWNGDLVVFAHGYIAFNTPLAFQHLSLPDGTYIPDLVQGLGFAFATTSYRRNGLAILEGADDMRELVTRFRTTRGIPGHTYVVGVSEGGIITTLLVEQSPQLFSGGLAGCGPIGDFRKQLNYYGDVRVVFDYFFPGVLPGSPISIPSDVIANWDSIYLPRIKAAIAANPSKARQAVIAAKAVVDASDPAIVETTLTRMLWYNVFATNDGVQQLGGNPFDNMTRVYTGTSSDSDLNLRVRRFRADAAALQNVTRYETTGRLTIPLMTIHTTGDELIPYWHEVLYVTKSTTSGKGHLGIYPVARHGHCNFTSLELLSAFGALVVLAA